MNRPVRTLRRRASGSRPTQAMQEDAANAGKHMQPSTGERPKQADAHDVRVGQPRWPTPRMAAAQDQHHERGGRNDGSELARVPRLHPRELRAHKVCQSRAKGRRRRRFELHPSTIYKVPSTPPSPPHTSHQSPIEMRATTDLLRLTLGNWQRRALEHFGRPPWTSARDGRVTRPRKRGIWSSPGLDPAGRPCVGIVPCGVGSQVHTAMSLKSPNQVLRERTSKVRQGTAFHRQPKPERAEAEPVSVCATAAGARGFDFDVACSQPAALAGPCVSGSVVRAASAESTIH